MAAHTMPLMATPYHPYHLAFGQFLCRYRSKVCNNPRAQKRNGSLHRYCEEHRQRANANQKKWARRRMQAADEFDMRRMELSYQLLLDTTPMVVAPNVSDANLQCHALPQDPDATQSPIDQWASEILQEDMPFFGDDSENDLLWSSLGLDESEDEVFI